MTTVSGVTTSLVTYADDTGLSVLPDAVLKLVFEYDSSSHSINPVLSKVCPRWKHCEQAKAERNWMELKSLCNGSRNPSLNDPKRLNNAYPLPGLIARIQKIEKKYFSEGAASWFERLDQRMEKALILNGANHVEIAEIRNRNLCTDSEVTPEKPEICIYTFFPMEHEIIENRDQNLETFWAKQLYRALGNGGWGWKAAQIRSWLKDRGNIDHPQIRILSLSGAKPAIRGIPPELARFISITHIDLARNSITSLPSTIGDLSSLLHLDLRGNPLKALPDKMGKLFENENFELVLDKEQFFRLYDQITRICPETTWYLKLFNTFILLIANLCYLFNWIINCGSTSLDPLKDLIGTRYRCYLTRDEIAAFDNKEIERIRIYRASCTHSNWDTFFSERRFRVEL